MSDEANQRDPGLTRGELRRLLAAACAHADCEASPCSHIGLRTDEAPVATCTWLRPLLPGMT
jgi:hypothetical protein